MATTIAKLNDDCLVSIFQIIPWQIGRNDEERPLNVIRAASQVYHRWRELLLSSPVIWGRVVDLGMSDCTYGLKRLEWMEDVVKRAGSAPLWISGRVIKPTSDFTFDSQSFFIGLLQKWERIERISVTIDDVIPDSIRNRFLSPAPILKLFEVHFARIHFHDPLFHETLQPSSSQHLFADYAPLLEVIRGDIAFKPDAPWLSGIREMATARIMLALQDIFVLLQHTPVLEHIFIDTWLNSSVGIYPPSTELSLPNLSYLSLTTTSSIAASILNYIIMSPRNLSVLRLDISDTKHHLDEDYIITSLQKNLPLYIASHLVSNPLVAVRILFFQHISFCISQSRYLTDDSPIGLPNGLPRDFNITIGFTPGEPKPNQDSLMACMYETLSLASKLGGKQSLFESVVGMHLSFCQVTPSSKHISTIYAILSLFNNIQFIIIDEGSVDIFNWMVSCHDEPNRVLFPKLHTVYLTRIIGYSVSHSLNDNFTEFFLRRKKTGFRVEVVWTEGEDHGDSVTCSYVGGTGDPQQLVCTI